jgi:hypothetical protein
MICLYIIGYIIIGLLTGYLVYKIRLNESKNNIKRRFLEGYITKEDYNRIKILNEDDYALIFTSVIIWYVALFFIFGFLIIKYITKIIEKFNKKHLKKFKQEMEEIYPEKFI